MKRSEGGKTEKRIASLTRSRKRWKTLALVSCMYAFLATCVLVSMLLLARDSGRSLFPKDSGAATVTSPTNGPDFADGTPSVMKPPEEPIETASAPMLEGTAADNRVSLLDAYVRTLSQESDAYPDMLVVLLRNDAPEAELLSATVAFAAIDALGAYIPIRGPYSEEPLAVFVGDMSGLHVIPGATYGENYGWRLNEGHAIARVEACVVSAEFSDGTKWENPEYALWKQART